MCKEMIKFTCILTAVLLVNADRSRAGTIVDNTLSTVSGHGTLFGPNDPPPQYYAQEFTTGSQGALLISVVVNIGGATTSPVTAFGELLTNNDGTPQGGTDLGNFTTTATIGAAYTNDTFTTTSNIMLAAHTSYWFVLGSTDNDYKWSFTPSNTANPDGSSITNYAFSHDLSTWTVETNGPFLIQVNGTPTVVPEPSSIVLNAIGCSAIAFTVVVRRRFASTGRAH
jgi:hypothetical protein